MCLVGERERKREGIYVCAHTCLCTHAHICLCRSLMHMITVIKNVDYH